MRRLPGILAAWILAAAVAPALPYFALAAEPADPRLAEAIAPAPAEPSIVVEASVVKIFSTVRAPDPVKPWTKQAPQQATGTGVVIEGERILTNAHLVLYASQVQVQAYPSSDKLPATVEAVSPGMDLAVLKLDDDSFFDTHPPLPRSPDLPALKDAVTVYGFPTGGTTLSITKGIVSRIEFVGYHFPASGLRIQIDAAINPGNSGGPALVGDRVSGLAFSRLGGADNVGYLIPSEEIDFFLADLADGHYDGKPRLFDELQTLENPALRSFLEVDEQAEGIIVTEVDSADPAYPLRQWDIITRIGDTPVDDEGMVGVSRGLRVRFDYLIQKVAKDGKVPLTIVRAGQEVAVEVPVAPERPMLIPDLEGSYPSYFVFGPMVFSTASVQFLAGLNDAEILTALSLLGNPLLTRRGDRPAFPGEALVIVSSPFFPHKLAKGYSNPIARVVKSINGMPVRNLPHLVESLRDSRDAFVVLEFAGRGEEALVFPRQETLAATDDILDDNGVRSQGSPDLMALWNAKPTR